jgi:phosphoglycerate kinase
MELPSVKGLPVVKKRVILRTDYDVPLRADGGVADETRIEDSLPTINYLLSQKAKVIIITHLDRPGGKTVPGLSLEPVRERLKMKLKKEVFFSGEVLGEKTKRMATALKPGEVLLLENLRFDPGEEANDPSLARGLAALAESYINDAFAGSHRMHASIVGLPAFLPSALGLDFLKEIEVLSRVRHQPKRPAVVILGGVKKSKIEASKKLVLWADYILVGGKLTTYDGVPEIVNHPKILGSLTKSGEDITIETIEEFKKIITKAKTIIWSGPLGAYEDKNFERGTKEIAQAVVASHAYTVVGGGDTEAALTKFGLVEKVDFISSGGGAMLEFLATGALPGIEAILR